MRISEIFTSIQGESTYAGRLCTFVRAAGCNLECTYCDTPYARDGGEEMTVEAVLDAVAAGRCTLVEITGGEPLLQSDTLKLSQQLLDKGYTVLLETNGTIDVSPVDERVVKIVDIKCPGSGMSDKTMWENLDLLNPHDEVKFVISDEKDYDWARDVVGRYGLIARNPVLLSPAHGLLESRRLAEWIVRDRFDARLQLQLHRIIWPDVERGV